MLKNKVLVVLAVASSISPVFASKTSAPQLVAADLQCISINSPIGFASKSATVDSNSIQVGSPSALVENLSNNPSASEKNDYSNNWNSAISDASVNLQRMPNGGLNGTITLTEIRKNIANAELQQKYGTAPVCVTGMALSLSHAEDKLDGGDIMLYLNTGDSINIEL